tara:strand:- start:306 stop:758 length:453 start_codon:yes stop_codon:yes gene_type:complete
MYKSLVGTLSSRIFSIGKLVGEVTILKKDEFSGVQSTNLTKDSKIVIVNCVNSYNIPKDIIMEVGSATDEFMRDNYDDEYIKTLNLRNPEQETMFWGEWAYKFISGVSSHKSVGNEQMVSDIKNKIGCVHNNIQIVASSNKSILDWSNKI